jgi:hypothetical protein
VLDYAVMEMRERSRCISHKVINIFQSHDEDPAANTQYLSHRSSSFATMILMPLSFVFSCILSLCLYTITSIGLCQDTRIHTMQCHILHCMFHSSHLLKSLTIIFHVDNNIDHTSDQTTDIGNLCKSDKCLVSNISLNINIEIHIARKSVTVIHDVISSKNICPAHMGVIVKPIYLNHKYICINRLCSECMPVMANNIRQVYITPVTLINIIHYDNLMRYLILFLFCVCCHIGIPHIYIALIHNKSQSWIASLLIYLMQSYLYRIYLHIRLSYISIQNFYRKENVKCTTIFSNSSIGGGRVPWFSYSHLRYTTSLSDNSIYHDADKFRFCYHIEREDLKNLIANENNNYVYGVIPLYDFVPNLTVKDMKYIADIHGIHVPSRLNFAKMFSILREHSCKNCENYISVFAPYLSPNKRSIAWYNNLDEMAKKKRKHAIYQCQKIRTAKHTIVENSHGDIAFPPLPPSANLQENIIRNWCQESSPDVFMEKGCAVCGQLAPLHTLRKLLIAKTPLNLLCRSNMSITRKERLSDKEAIEEIDGPVIDNACTDICLNCKKSLENGKIPKFALANGLWIGKIPLQLSNLTFAEKLLIARVRHNSCIVRVSSGMHKMKANVIMFKNPTPKIYRRLPPPIDELDEVLAFIFTGPCKPTSDDLK